MKKPSWPKFTSEIYKEAGYSDEAIANIKWLESLHPSVESLLSEYRYVQPDGELFSEHSLKLITTLHNIQRMLEARKELSYDIEIELKILLDLVFKQKNGADNFISECGLF